MQRIRRRGRDKQSGTRSPTDRERFGCVAQSFAGMLRKSIARDCESGEVGEMGWRRGGDGAITCE